MDQFWILHYVIPMEAYRRRHLFSAGGLTESGVILAVISVYTPEALATVCFRHKQSVIPDAFEHFLLFSFILLFPLLLLSCQPFCNLLLVTFSRLLAS